MKDLTTVLKECRNYAKRGHKIASEKEESIKTVLQKAEQRLQNTLKKINSSKFNSSETTGALEEQLSEIQKNYEELSSDVEKKLNVLRSNLSDFSVVLFGRTMAGKSTLMEILTEGNGDTIGKGMQRTTRNIRKYTWNGLQITDVPGIDAFKGEKDQQKAFNAANKADLVLFLITDDDPQAAEAECFSKIIAMGKPVIFIINVKVDVEENTKLKLFQRYMQKAYDPERLGNIREQFLEYAECYEQSWDNIPFVYVHLKSAFLAHKIKNKELADTYYQLSRIDELKNKIIGQVETKGKFLRIRTFIDTMSYSISGPIQTFLSQSRLNSSFCRTLTKRKEQLGSWKKQFEKDGNKQIDTLIKKMQNDLNSKASAFAEKHFDDRSSDIAWRLVLKNYGIGSRCMQLYNSLCTEAKQRSYEISEQTINELRFTISLPYHNNIKMSRIIDWKKIFERSADIVSVLFQIFKNNIAAFAVQGVEKLVSPLFKSREKKEAEARAKLGDKLNENIQNICSSCQRQMKNYLKKITSSISEQIRNIENANDIISELADAQRKFAWELNDQLLDLNKRIITEGMKFIGDEKYLPRIKDAARIPGTISLIMFRDDPGVSKKAKRSLRRSLNELMSESINFVSETNDKRRLISMITGIKMDSIKLEEKKGTASVPGNAEVPENKIELAQQLSKTYIEKNRR